MREKYAIALFFLLLMPCFSYGIVYLDNILEDYPDDLHLYVYYFNSQDNEWQVVWQEQLRIIEYKEKKLPNYDLSAFEGGILVAVQGPAVYYSKIKQASQDINISFTGETIKFYTVSWLGSSIIGIGGHIEGINIKVACYIPEMNSYVDLYNTEADRRDHKLGEVILHYVNPLYKYKLIFEGLDIYTREIALSSDEDFEEPHLDHEGNIIYKNTVRLIKKNSIYGSLQFENSDFRIQNLHANLCFWNTETGNFEFLFPPNLFSNNRFLFIVPKGLRNERLSLICKHPLTQSDIFFHDLVISKEPYELFFDIENGIAGRVANQDIDFPVIVNARLQGIAVNSRYNFKFAMNDSFKHYNLKGFETETDTNGYFLVPNPYYGKGIFLSVLSDPDKAEDVTDIAIYYDLYLENEGIKLGYRYYFNPREVSDFIDKPMMIDIGDVIFQECVDISGRVINEDNESVSGVSVFLRYQGCYNYIIIPLDESNYFNTYYNLEYSNSEIADYLSDASIIHSITDNNGHFNISRGRGLIPGIYDIYLVRDSYVITYYPDISIKKDTDIGSLLISDGNSLKLSIITGMSEEDIRVVLKFRTSELLLINQSAHEGILKYYADRLIPFGFYKLFIYNDGNLLREIDVSYEFDERNVEKTIDITL